MIVNINNSYLYYNADNNSCVSSYFEYLIYIICEIFKNDIQLNINIILGNYQYAFDNNNKTIKIGINYEHTLVKPGGRSSNDSPLVKICIDNMHLDYLVRIQDFDELNNSDIIIDYSIPNIHHVSSCNLFNDFSEKYVYIAPSFCDCLYFSKENREFSTLTTFMDINQKRRSVLLDNIKNKNIKHTNINTCFSKNDLTSLYKNTKVLINIHQTDHHHTFEELRILPALMCGVIVISENSPLSNLIPYNDYIIWSSYENILDKAKEVLENYDFFHDLIFSNTKINNIVDNLHEENYKSLYISIKLNV